MDTKERLSREHQPRPFPRALALAALVLTLGACAGSGGVVDRTLQTVGLREAAPDGPQVLDVELMAGSNLNAGNGAGGLALVVKAYQLRDARRFEQAPAHVFLDDDDARTALGDDLIAVSEVVLAPSQRDVLQERLHEDAVTVGLVALFQAPAANRWRLAFDPREASAKREGIRVGLHACAMTTTSPALTTRLAGDPASLASVRCQAPTR